MAQHPAGMLNKKKQFHRTLNMIVPRTILLDSKIASGFSLKDVITWLISFDTQTSDSSSAVNRWLSRCIEAQSRNTTPRKHLTKSFGSKVVPVNLKVLQPSSVLG